MFYSVKCKDLKHEMILVDMFTCGVLLSQDSILGISKDIRSYRKCFSKVSLRLPGCDCENNFKPWHAADVICRLPYEDGEPPDQPAHPRSLV